MKIKRIHLFEKTNSKDIFNIITLIKSKNKRVSDNEWKFILSYATPNWRGTPDVKSKFFIVNHKTYKAIKIPFLGELIFQNQ